MEIGGPRSRGCVASAGNQKPTAITTSRCVARWRRSPEVLLSSWRSWSPSPEGRLGGTVPQATEGPRELTELRSAFCGFPLLRTEDRPSGFAAADPDSDTEEGQHTTDHEASQVHQQDQQ